MRVTYQPKYYLPALAWSFSLVTVIKPPHPPLCILYYLNSTFFLPHSVADLLKAPSNQVGIANVNTSFRVNSPDLLKHESNLTILIQHSVLFFPEDAPLMTKLWHLPLLFFQLKPGVPADECCWVRPLFAGPGADTDNQVVDFHRTLLLIGTCPSLLFQRSGPFSFVVTLA